MSDTISANETQRGYAAANQKFCFGCGAPMHMDAPACPKCGAPQTSAKAGEKSRVAAILLALFLGGLGAHKFYLNRPGWGVLYLIFCWTFIPALIAFVEMIIYICMSDQDFKAKYG
ncbi:TM2 domain-containing protein [Sphingomonas koreensis]|uniref:TM2 domain-containing protein n=1 Tax=Sphingomonas koreensis TaxID=93064 RepID=UPI000F7F1357|nr:TM2 domain-containing protein [Sphingomonas koreensis]RSU91496.1 NINE protein [Sphingomonas koreensis]